MMLYKLLKKPFFGAFMVKWRNPLTEDEKKEWKRYEVKSKSGGLIVGLFAKAKTTAPKATIVLGHPMGKEAKGYFIKNGYTELLRNKGYNVIVFDLNGFGESSHGNFSYYEDIVAISVIAKQLTPDLRIGYHGISLGGQWATIAFADISHQYDFAIIESAATTLEEFWVNYPFAYYVLRLWYFFTPNYKKKITMVERIKEAKNLKSMLFIYSAADHLTPVSMGKRYLNNSPLQSELWIVETAKHASIMKSEHRHEYEEKMISFFENALSH